MMYRSTRTRAELRLGAIVISAAALAVVAGCSQRAAAPTSAARATVSSSSAVAGVGDELGQLRAATARFQDIEVAKQNGYTIPITGCMVDQSPAALGGMGYHFGKESALNNPVPNALEPEALLYEPQENGRYRLVGLEFIIPYTLLARSSAPPKLFGQEFKQNDVFQVWALHTWIWRNNPSGMFADWNPKVNCDAAPAAARSSHGAH